MIRREEFTGPPGGAIPDIGLRILTGSDLPEVLLKADLARFHHLDFHFPWPGRRPPAGR